MTTPEIIILISVIFSWAISATAALISFVGLLKGKGAKDVKVDTTQIKEIIDLKVDQIEKAKSKQIKISKQNSVLDRARVKFTEENQALLDICNHDKNLAYANEEFLRVKLQ